MDDRQHLVRWALGAFGFGGALLGVAKLESLEARKLANFPDLTSLKDLKTLEGSSVTARGKASTSEPINDTLSRRPAVASYVDEDEICRKRVGNDWKTESKRIHRRHRGGNIFLQLDNGNCVHLKPASDKDFHPVMEHAVSIPRSNSANILQQAVEGVLGYMITGFVEHEFILPVDTEITAVGRLAAGGPGGKPDFILEPIKGQLTLYRRTISEQVQHMERWSRGLKWAALGCGVAGAVLTGIHCFRIGRRMLEKRKQRKQEQRFLRDAEERRARLRASGSGGASGGASEPRSAVAPGPSEQQEWSCNVCWETGGVQTVFPSCGHVAVCQNCAERLLHCPVCRTPSRARRLFYT